MVSLKEYLTVNEVAEMFDVHPQTVRYWIKNRGLGAVKSYVSGHGHRIAIRRASLKEFMKNDEMIHNKYRWVELTGRL